MSEKDYLDALLKFSEKLGGLTKALENLETHFTNHLHTHKWNKIMNGIYFLAVIIMFCFLKWGV
jgi:hypothetical protein